ncbi:MAG TPA: YccF domain-containing protein [Streptosporangiaceae bacterium]|jgi:uncharacterized membrane protein YccF (DUF307 family)
MDEPPLTGPQQATLTFMWLVLGGLLAVAAYALAGVVEYALVITAPYGRAAFRSARWFLTPYGDHTPRPVYVDGWRRTRRAVWLVTAAWWLALVHMLAAVLLALTGAGRDLGGVHTRFALNLFKAPRAG